MTGQSWGVENGAAHGGEIPHLRHLWQCGPRGRGKSRGSGPRPPLCCPL